MILYCRWSLASLVTGSDNPGTKGPITGEAGNLGYQEICLKIKNEGWTAVEDSNGPYAYGSGNQWVGYDTIKSVTAKAEYVKSKGLGGAMFWDLATDDFNVSIHPHLLGDN